MREALVEEKQTLEVREVGDSGPWTAREATRDARWAGGSDPTLLGEEVRGVEKHVPGVILASQGAPSKARATSVAGKHMRELLYEKGIIREIPLTLL